MSVYVCVCYGTTRRCSQCACVCFMSTIRIDHGKSPAQRNRAQVKRPPSHRLTLPPLHKVAENSRFLGNRCTIQAKALVDRGFVESDAHKGFTQAQARDKNIYTIDGGHVTTERRWLWLCCALAVHKCYTLTH